MNHFLMARSTLEDYSQEQVARMHKAITILQLKLEAQIIGRHPEYEMEARLLLDAINPRSSVIRFSAVASAGALT